MKIMLKMTCMALAFLLLPVCYAKGFTVAAKSAAKELKVNCKSLPQAPSACVIAQRSGPEGFYKPPRHVPYFRVLVEKREDGAWLLQDFYMSGGKRSNIFAVSFSGNSNTGVDIIDAAGFGAVSGAEYAEGELQVFYDNGRMAYNTVYDKSGEQMFVKFWHRNGQLYLYVPLTAGRANGLVVDYYENGQKRSEAEYKIGERIGKYKVWSENGEGLREVDHLDLLMGL